MLKIVHLESNGFSEKAAQLLSSIGSLSLLNAKTEKEAATALEDADIAIFRLKFQINETLLENAKKLKIIGIPVTGLDFVDTDYLEKRDVEIISLKGETDFLDSVFATSEHTLALTLALLRKIPTAHNAVVNDKLWRRDLFIGSELAGKTVGIIGFGRIGKRVASYFETFGCTILGVDLKNVVYPDFVIGTSLENLLQNSDIVSLHIDWNSENRNFMDEEKLKQMKKGSFFINTSRGSLVDEKALLKLLKSNHLAGAALDVIKNEYNQAIEQSEIVSYADGNPNLIITPHIGGATFESMEKTEIFIAKRVLKFANKIYTLQK